MKIWGEAAARSITADFSPRAQVALLSCACAGASAFLFFINPNRHAVYPQCAFHRLTGLYCAGCGATRAAYALLHGRVLDGLHDNALFVAALPVLAILVGSVGVRTWRRNAWPRSDIMKPEKLALGAAGIFLLMVAFMVVRNLPGFEVLRPLVQ